MRVIIAAGALYFALVFVAGFALGVVRTVSIAPRWGEARTVAAELPVMLAVSWAACLLVTRRCGVPDRVSDRLAMGTIALALLLGAEVVVSIALAGRTLSQHLSLYATAPALLGLAAQLLFAAFPLLQRVRRATTPP